MSVLVPSLTSHHHHHHPTYYPSTNSTRRMNGNSSHNNNNNNNRLLTNDQQQDNDHVPFGVVNSMKQRLLNKVNESYLNSTLTRHSISKQSSSSNENLLQTKPHTSPLKHFTRLSRSQDNLTNQTNLTEQITSYIQAKQDVIIVETIINDDEPPSPPPSQSQPQLQEKLHPGHKISIHRQSYTELHVDEAPKPGTVTTVKNMFERQIRLSRYDGEKLFNSSTPNSSRMSSQHREHSSPIRSRSTSPYEHIHRQKRPMISISSVTTTTTTTLSLPVPTSYPDVVISHTPPTDTNKNHTEQIPNENLLITKEKKSFHTNRHSNSHEQTPLNVLIDDNSSANLSNSTRPNLLLTSIDTSEAIDSQPLDFKSRLALFNRTNLEPSNDNFVNIKKSSKIFHQQSNFEEKKDQHFDCVQNQFSRTVVNTAKAVTFFGGNKLNAENYSSLPNTIPPPPPPSSSSSSKPDATSSNEPVRVPDIIGGNVKLNKSSIYSGTRKDTRVQFHENVDTFEYPSFEVALAELGSTASDNDDEENLSSLSSNEDNDKKEEISNHHHHHHSSMDDVDDDELERLARINAEFNTNNLSEKSLKPKGTLHTFRPTHLDQYELGSQHDNHLKSSDMSTSKHSSYTILARQKLLFNSDNSTKISHSKPSFDLPNNIQWSSMSTTTDLLF